MNIVFVNATRRFGGVKAWTLDVARKLKDFGHNVFIFARPGPFMEKALEAGLDARAPYFGLDYNPIGILGFFRFFRKEQIDMVVLNVGKDMRIAGVAARLANIPTVQRIGLPRDMRDTLKVRLTHNFVQPWVLVPCEYIKKGLLSEFSFLHPQDIQVILTGKDPAKTPPETVSTPRQMIVTSQLNPDKGHRELFIALSELKSKKLDFHCHILGTGKIEQKLHALGDSLGLSKMLTWHGFQKDVRSHLAKADIFVLPSKSEGLPNTLLEAMAQGLVPVAGNVGGVNEVWPSKDTPGMPDLIFDPKQGIHGLIDCLETALSAPDEQVLAWKKSVWQWFGAHFSLDQQARLLEKWLGGITGP
ncbi:MAG: glycosyltransferase [Thermodesulfobacteriota bacterium]|nr:glycosyltransferase [Thermodesulfobacteriota bacterium]